MQFILKSIVSSAYIITQDVRSGLFGDVQQRGTTYRCDTKLGQMLMPADLSNTFLSQRFDKMT